MAPVFEEKRNNYLYIVICCITVHLPGSPGSPGLCRHLVVASGTLFSGNNGSVFSQSIKCK